MLLPILIMHQGVHRHSAHMCTDHRSEVVLSVHSWSAYHSHNLWTATSTSPSLLAASLLRNLALLPDSSVCCDYVDRPWPGHCLAACRHLKCFTQTQCRELTMAVFGHSVTLWTVLLAFFVQAKQTIQLSCSTLLIRCMRSTRSPGLSMPTSLRRQTPCCTAHPSRYCVVNLLYLVSRSSMCVKVATHEIGIVMRQTGPVSEKLTHTGYASR